MELDISNWGKSRSSNSIFGGLEKYSAERWGVRDHVMRGMLMQTDQRARTKVLLFMKPFYLNCQLSCEPGISIVCCFLTGPFQTHNCFKRKLTSAWFFFSIALPDLRFSRQHPIWWLHGITWDFSNISIHCYELLINESLILHLW